ncbi:MAG TPA: nickel-binding protein [Actinomycetota bacterium]|jgi:hypothetical protein
MPRYLIERNFGTINDDVMKGYGERSANLVRDEFPDVTWEHSHVVVDDAGTFKTFCVYLAPDEERVFKHSERLGGHTIEKIYEIGGDVSPSDFTAF